MPLFTRTNSLAIDLGELDLKQIMGNYPKKEKTDLEEFYLKQLLAPNHLEFGCKSRFGGIHDLSYDPVAKKINIFSRHRKSNFLIYASLIMVFIPLILSENVSNIAFQITGIGLALVVFATMLLIIGIRSESKRLEQEMIISINHFRRNPDKHQ